MISPKTFGYIGTLPFILFLIASLAISKQNAVIALNIIQAGYASLVLSFLAGAHWGQAVPSNDISQYKVAIGFVGAVFLAFVTTIILMKSSLTMVIYASLFWVMYLLDRKFMPEEFIDKGYFEHRKILTMIVSASLFLSAFY